MPLLGIISLMPIPQHQPSSPSPSDFDRALRAIVQAPKSEVIKAEQRQKRERQASKRKGKRGRK